MAGKELKQRDSSSDSSSDNSSDNTTSFKMRLAVVIGICL